MATLISFHNIVCDTILASSNSKSKRALLSKLVTGSRNRFFDPTPKTTCKQTSKDLVLNGSIDYAIGASVAGCSFSILVRCQDSAESILFFHSQKTKFWKATSSSMSARQSASRNESNLCCKIEFTNVKLPLESVVRRIRNTRCAR